VSPDLEFDLVRWDTPFGDAVYPSVTLLPEPGGGLRVVVSPHGIDRYPKYLVDFDGEVVGYLHEQESWAHPLPPEIRGEPDLHCACLWLDSPWLRQYDASRKHFEEFVEPVVGGTLKHYCLFGGDSVVQIVFAGEPSISVIPGPVVFETAYEA
jgi:hypothetical protein